MKTFEQKSAGTASGIRLLGVLAIVCLCGIALVPPVAATEQSAATTWIGTWNTGASTPVASQTIGILTLTQTGSSVIGTFTNHDGGRGTVTGTVAGNVLAGTWTVKYGGAQSDSGSYKFVLSDDKNSFAGSWVSASDTMVTLSTTEDFWNGAR